MANAKWRYYRRPAAAPFYPYDENGAFKTTGDPTGPAFVDIIACKGVWTNKLAESYAQIRGRTGWIGLDRRVLSAYEQFRVPGQRRARRATASLCP